MLPAVESHGGGGVMEGREPPVPCHPAFRSACIRQPKRDTVPYMSWTACRLTGRMKLNQVPPHSSGKGGVADCKPFDPGCLLSSHLQLCLH